MAFFSKNKNPSVTGSSPVFLLLSATPRDLFLAVHQWCWAVASREAEESKPQQNHSAVCALESQPWNTSGEQQNIAILLRDIKGTFIFLQPFIGP